MKPPDNCDPLLEDLPSKSFIIRYSKTTMVWGFEILPFGQDDGGWISHFIEKLQLYFSKVG